MALSFVNQIGAVEGMNQAAPGTFIPESFVRWSQDALFDRAGLIRRRGPFDKFDLFKTNAITGLGEEFDFTESDAEDERILAVLSTYDPTGAERIGMLVDSYDEDTSTRKTILRVFDNSFTFLGQEVLPFDVTNLSIVSAKPALGGGLWISLANDPANSDTHYQFFWRGGYNSTTKASCSVSFTTVDGFANGLHGHDHGTFSKTFTIPNNTDISVGMFVYLDAGSGNFKYLGTIFSVSASSFVLEKHPFVWLDSINQNVGNTSAGAGEFDSDTDYTGLSLKFISVRPYEHVHGRGLLSTDTVSAGDQIISGDEGTSGEGHWLAANVTNYNVYRASDNAYFGKIESVEFNDSATLYEHTGANISGEEYIMRPSTEVTLFPNSFQISERSATNFSGLYTAVYAGYQWYGNFANDDQNTNRVVFSAAHDKEAVDLSRDAADSIIFPGKSKFRGLGASSAGLLVFLEDRTYILRGNDRTNFSVEQLVPEGCLCPSSIVEYGGGVFWAGKSGIMYFDGASVRNLTKNNLGLYYTDSLDVFNPEQDRVIGFIHKNNLIMHYTSWKSPFDPIRYEPIYAEDWQNTEGIADRSWDEFDPDFDYDDFFTQNNTPIFWDQKILNNPEESASIGKTIEWDDGSTWGDTTSINKWGPLRKNTSITFNVYLPTNSVTTLSNMDFRGVTSIETVYGLKTIVGINSIENNRLRARFIDIHPVFDVNTYGEDAYIVEKINIPFTDLIKGPDLYIQTKHFTVGDPILRKWFQRVLLSMLLYDGAMRMDLVDDDDNDDVDINKKKHRNWEIFTEKGYNWDYLGKGEGNDFGVVFPKLTSPNKSTWENVQGTVTYWSELFTSDFNRYSKRISWRKTSAGFRLYQLNDYKKPFEGVVTKPNRVEIQGFSIGFKPLRQGRI